jgi:hypothetical protein
MKKPFLISLVVFVIVTSCSGRKDIPTTSPSIMPKPSFTATLTPTVPQPTKTPVTPTITPFRFTKQNKSLLATTK